MLTPFLKSEAGAVTADWVVKTAMLTTLGVAAVPPLYNGINGVNIAVESKLTGEMPPGSRVEVTIGAGGPYSPGPLGELHLLRDHTVVSHSFDLGTDVDAAYVDVDFYSIGSLNPNDHVMITVNGIDHRVSLGPQTASDSDGLANEAYTDAANVTIENGDVVMTDPELMQSLIDEFMRPGLDASETVDVASYRQHTVRVRVDNPGQALDVQVGMHGDNARDRVGEAVGLRSINAVGTNPSEI